MAATLKEQITSPETRPLVVKECVELVETEVRGKGLFIRGAYKTVKKIKPGFVQNAIDGLLDDWLDRMEPFYGKWREDGSGNYAGYLEAHKGEVADELLKVTDERAKSSRHRTAAKMYGKLRPSALKNVESAVPGLGKLIESHLGD